MKNEWKSASSSSIGDKKSKIKSAIIIGDKNVSIFFLNAEEHEPSLYVISHTLLSLTQQLAWTTKKIHWVTIVSEKRKSIFMSRERERVCDVF